MTRKHQVPKDMIEVSEHNRRAWNELVRRGNEWTVPVDSETVARARDGDWSVVLTPSKPVPREWFGQIGGKRILGLASAGGQQAPILAAAGAQVTVLDNSPAQLASDRLVAQRDGLDIRIEEGLMQDLSRFPDDAFDLIFHPISNCFVEDILAVWREAFRVLSPGGRILAGFCNPVLYGFDPDASGVEALTWQFPLPYSDLESRAPKDLARHLAAGEPIEFSHSLETQIGGQLQAGFRLLALYEDTVGDWTLAQYFPPFIATLAEKPRDPRGSSMD